MLASDLTVKTEGTSSLTLIPNGLGLTTHNLTKEGPGTCVLGSGLFLLGNVNVNGGTLQLAKDLLTFEGGDVQITAGATLKTSGTVNRRVLGGPGGTLEVLGTTDIGLLSSTDGYDFAGALKVGPYMVGLKDADLAKVYKGATLAGGKLSSFNGIELQAGTVGSPTVSGYGTIDGAVRLNSAVVKGVSSTQKITLPGIVSGTGTLVYVTLTGLDRRGSSPVYLPMAYVDYTSQSASVMEVWGQAPGHMEYSTTLEDIVKLNGDYHQFGAFAPVTLDGKLTVSLMGGFVPVPGANEFRMFESLDTSLYFGWEPGVFRGWFKEVTLPASMKPDWFWTFTYADGSSSSGMAPTGEFLSGTLTAIPEPGTLALLITGGLGLLALAGSRLRRR